MNAVYKIKVEHRLGDVCEWYASAVRLSDDMYMLGSGFYAGSSEEAIKKVRDWIVLESTRKEGFEVYADDYGNLVEVASGLFGRRS